VYAIIQDGAHQYKVQDGDILEVQLHDLDEGQEAIEFNQVLMIGDENEHRIGRPFVEGAKVRANVVDTVKGDKIIIQKFRRRKGYALKKGHRQRFLQVKVEKIKA